MLHEFTEFVKIIDSKDTKRAETMLDISAAVCSIVEKVRKQSGILFAGE